MLELMCSSTITPGKKCPVIKTCTGQKDPGDKIIGTQIPRDKMSSRHRPTQILVPSWNTERKDIVLRRVILTVFLFVLWSIYLYKNKRTKETVRFFVFEENDFSWLSLFFRRERRFPPHIFTNWFFPVKYDHLSLWFSVVLYIIGYEKTSLLTN